MAAPQQIEQVRLPSVCTCFPARRAVNTADGPTAISHYQNKLILIDSTANYNPIKKTCYFLPH